MTSRATAARRPIRNGRAARGSRCRSSSISRKARSCRCPRAIRTTRRSTRSPTRSSGVPDRCMESHFEYGTKAAWWRLADTLQRLGVPATVSSCGQAAELSPWLIEDAVKRGHEISCHGWRWEKHAHMEEAEEREAIARTVKVLTEIAGERPGRLAHPLDALAQHAPPAGRGRRLPLRQRRLFRRPAVLRRGLGQAAPGAALQLRHQRHALSPGLPSLRDGARLRRLHDRRLRHAVGRGRAASEDDVDRPAPAHDRPPRPHRRARPHRGAHEAGRAAPGSPRAARSPSTGWRVSRPSPSAGRS